uniref:MotA/TolQ/ExbB proton channel (TolQ) n=1 Tax=uncultured marine thaumarchaeote AD1000_06_A03 TaxID=1455884 RepID=A0A075FHE8_9ARCH|nr:MotA/TolQ/ExbB proton channel (tolQ) [uncultured marine thaumarchaeote AD1000_06_A03]
MRNLFYYALTLLQTTQLNVSEGYFGGDILGLIQRSSPLSKAILLILILFSITSWAIILLKFRQLRKVDSETKSFLAVFRRSSKFSEVQSVCKSLPNSPLVGVFQAGYVELNAQLNPTDIQDNLIETNDPQELKSLNALDRALLRASSVEINKLERHVPFLATTASVTPFIGLFGTVWGIMGAFTGIGEVGSTSLAVVAPGIAEALIATAAGLFAAIPAVYFYNHLTQKIKELASTMDDFSLEFLNIAERNFT